MKKWPRYPTSPIFACLLILVGMAPLLLLAVGLVSDEDGYAAEAAVAWALIVASPGAILLLVWKSRKTK